MESYRTSRPAKRNALSVALFSPLLCMLGCHASFRSHTPVIHFTQVPKHVAIGGPADVDPFKGWVSNNKPGTKIMLYSLTEGTWWVQPARSRGYTDIAADGKWHNQSHRGERYAALLVNENYRLSARIPALPELGGDVLAIATTPGDSTPLPEPKLLHFSGYDWKVRSRGGDTSGSFCDYKDSNVWVDEKGYLHLRMEEEGGEWHCAGLLMAHSLGYGTYRFVIADSEQLPPSATFDMFLRPDHEDPDERSGFSIALGQFGNKDAPNVDFVVQPYYVPGNSVRFHAPAGVMSYVLRWEPAKATFKSLSGVESGPHKAELEQVFRAGIPVPAEETVHLNFYDFHHSQSGLRHPVEIVVQRFEYLP